MTVELHTHELIYPNPPEITGGAFLAGLDGIYAKEFARVGKIFSVYEAVGTRILKHRNSVVPDSARWDVAGWTGLFIKIDLKPDEGFDVLHDYYEWLSFQTKNYRPTAKTFERKADPDPEDYAEIRRRSWVFRVDNCRCTLAAFANANSEICKQVEVGTQPKYELICAGSPLPIGNAINA